MYKLQDWAAVQRVYKQTQSKRETARILGMSRNTVRKLLEQKVNIPLAGTARLEPRSGLSEKSRPEYSKRRTNL